MRNWFRTSMMAAGVAAVVTLVVVPTVLRGQAPAAPAARPAAAPARVPRTADGKPNLNVEDHGASAGPFFQEGAVGAIPAGQSVVDGGDIPYTPAALAKRNENM